MTTNMIQDAVRATLPPSHSLQTERYSAEDTLYQYLMPEGKLYPSL